MSETAKQIDVDRWRKAIAQDVRSNYHFEMGRALLRQNETQAGLTHLRQTLAILPEHWTARVVLTDFLIGQGVSVEAARNEGGTNASSPLWEALGRRQLREEALDGQDWSTALKHAEKIIQFPGSDAGDRWFHAVAMVLNGNITAGSIEFNTVPVGAVSAEEAQQTHKYGYQLFNKGDYGSASIIFDQCVRMAPDDAMIQSAAGITHQCLGTLDKALPLLRKAAVLAPHSAGVWHSLALALLDAGLLDETEDALRQAHELAPELMAIKSSFALLALRRGMTEEADQISADCIVHSDPQGAAWIAMNRALILAASGHMSKAAEHFRHALQAGPGIAHAAIPLRRWAREPLETLEQMATSQTNRVKGL